MKIKQTHREIDLQFELHPDCISAYVENLKGEVFEQESVKFIELSAYEQLQKENEYLNRTLADRDSGVQDETHNKHLRWEIEKLTQALKVAEDALGFNYEYYAAKQHKCIDLLKDQKKALAQIKKLKGEI